MKKITAILFSFLTVVLCADESGVKTLYWLDANSGANWRFTKWATEREGSTLVPWEDGSIADVRRNIHLWDNANVSIYALDYWGSGAVMATTNSVLTIGAGGIRQYADNLYFRMCAASRIHCAADQTWAYVGSARTNQLNMYFPNCVKEDTGDYLVMPVVSAEPGTTLTVSAGNTTYLSHNAAWDGRLNGASILHWGFSGDLSGSTLVAERMQLTMGHTGAGGGFPHDTHLKAWMNADELVLDQSLVITQAKATNRPAGARQLARKVTMKNGSRMASSWGGLLDMEEIVVESGANFIDSYGLTTGHHGQFDTEVLALDIKAGASLQIEGLFDQGKKPMVLLAGAGDLILKDIDAYYEPHIVAVDGYTGTITVANVTVHLPPSDLWPEGMRVVTVGTGQVLVGGSSLYTNADLAARVTGDGTCVVDDHAIYVTDEVVGLETLELTGGDAVYVAGNGLTAATTITRTAHDDKYVYFRFVKSATVASAITVPSGNLWFEAFPGCVGELSGTVVMGANTVNDSANLVFGGGKLNFTGNFTGSKEKGTFLVDGAKTELAVRGKMTLCAPVDCGMAGNNGGGRITVENGGVIRMEYTPDQKYLVVSGVKDVPGVLEIQTGGLVEFFNNKSLLLGGRKDSYGPGYLIVNGGMMKFNGNGFRPNLCSFVRYGRSRVEFKAGEIILTRPIEASYMCDFVWSGGSLIYPRNEKMDMGNTGFLWPTIFNSDKVDMQIVGDATLDFTQATDIKQDLCWTNANIKTDMIGRVPPAWRGTGTLHVKGLPAKNTTFVIDEGSALAAGATRPTIAGEGVNIKYLSRTDGAAAPAGGVQLGTGTVVAEDFTGANVDIVADKLVIADADTSPAQLKSALLTDTAVVKAGGVWDSSVWTDAVLPLKDLVFEENSTLKVVKVGGTVAAKNLSGALTLPAAMNVVTASGSAGQTLFTAATAIEKEDTTWTAVSGSGSSCLPVVNPSNKRALMMELRGFLLIFR